uniref:Uncharacterized protein n=1 Tax=Mycena chlorophos TaxID=658473 RepID=A0ABQ0KXE2_MYCCL|nr:predicted protein [Mycena chlorophos]
MAPDRSQKQQRGAHGGARAGAGRPRKDPTPKPPPPPRLRATQPPADTSQVVPGPFFLPRRPTQPVPGNDDTFWAAAHPESTVQNGVNGVGGSGMTTADVQQLQNELDFISENDEHADIARGDVLVEESLVGEVLGQEDELQDDDEDSASEPPPESSITRYLRSVRDRVQAEIDTHGEPLCYRRGDLYERAPHPVFTLKTCFTRTEEKKHPEDVLYARDICIWLPRLLPGAPEHFKCLSHLDRFQ